MGKVRVGHRIAGTRAVGRVIERVQREGLGEFGDSGGESWWIGGVMASVLATEWVTRWRP